MKIRDHRALPGPNHYSPYPTIHMLLDLEELADTPTSAIPGFADRLAAVLPSLGEHRCSEGHEGGFLERVRQGTWLGHVVEHVALELQCLAGMRVGFGKTRETSEPGVYRIVYRYREERSGLEAGRMAVDLIEDVAGGKPYDVRGAVAELQTIHDANRLGPSTLAIVQEARRRGIPVMRLDDASYIQLGYGSQQQRVQATLTGRTSCIGCEIADDKDRTKDILDKAGIPVPRGVAVRTLEGAKEVAEEIGYPVVVKPLVGNHGRGISTDLKDPAQVEAAFAVAKALHPSVLVERHVHGHDFRVLVVNHKFVAAARRDPAQVVGDGVRTVAQLVEETNRDPRRGTDHEKSLTRIHVDAHSLQVLQKQGLTLESVPQAGQVVPLKGTANMSTGGTATDVTAEVCQPLRRMCERASRLVGLDIMGLDIVAPTLTVPLADSGGAVVEVNAAPGIRMHLEPSHGTPRNVGARIVDMLFPHGGDARIPIVAVTGTNGKTTTVRLITHILAMRGARVGMATTTGVEIEGDVVLAGDYSGPDGARTVLQDPGVDHAVLEVARGGILRRGLGFDQCDVGVFLNVASDHLGEGGIDTLDDLADLKAVVVESARRSGTAVLNADDPRVVRYRDTVRARTLLFSMKPDSPIVREHLVRAGKVVTLSGNDIVVRDAEGDQVVTSVDRCPITFGGKAAFNVQNILAAVAATHALGLALETIRAGVESFQPSPQHLPGRLNLIDMGTHRVLVDYGHNVAALEALAPIVEHLAGNRAITVASCTGNRRDEDLRAFGRALSRIYDHIVLCDPDPRGRAPGETMGLVHQGTLEEGMDPSHVETAATEEDAVRRALGMAAPGDLVVLQMDNIRRALEVVEELRSGHGPNDGLSLERPRPRRPGRTHPAHLPDADVRTVN